MNKTTGNKTMVKRLLDRMVRMLRWPEDKRTGLVPWFVILWRMLWFPLMMSGHAIAWFGIAMSHGVYWANKYWDDAT